MKLLKPVLRSILAASLMLAVALAWLLPAAAQVAPFAPRTGTFDSLAAVSTNSATLTVNSTGVTVYPDRGMAVFPSFTGLGAGTSNLTFAFDVSYDGTVWSTTGPLSYTVAMNGTNPVVGYFLIPKTSLDNVKKIRLKSIANANASNATLTSVTWAVVPVLP